MRLTLIPKKSQGFTLMELMVIIAILGVLSAIAVPMFMKQRKKGNEDVSVYASVSVDLSKDDLYLLQILCRQSIEHGTSDIDFAKRVCVMDSFIEKQIQVSADLSDAVYMAE